MVTVDALFATFDTDGVIPVGVALAVVPATLVYQVTVPVVPAAMLAVVTANVALPAVPPVIVPTWAATLTVGVATAVKVGEIVALPVRVTIVDADVVLANDAFPIGLADQVENK